MLPWFSKIKAFNETVVAFFALLAVFVFSFFVLVGFAPVTHAQDVFGTQPIEQTTVLSGMDIRVIVVRIINVALGLLGIITLGLILYAGFLIMTSGGQEDKIAEGKKVLTRAVVGLVIILSAFAIVQFVFKMLTGGEYGKPPSDTPPILLTFSGSGALGKVVKDHYPFRDQTDVARNTSIVVTFGTPVEPSSIAINHNKTCWTSDFLGSTTTCTVITDDGINGGVENPYFGDCYDLANDGINWTVDCDYINTSTIVFNEKDILNVSGKNDIKIGLGAAFLATYEDFGTQQGRNLYTIVIKPFEYLGSSVEEKWYTVDLRQGINAKGNLESIFADMWSKHYYWDFQTGTGLDLSPPHITSVYPKTGQTVAKNTILQINFDEAVDPTVTQGYFSQTTNFNNILVNTGGAMVTGTWKITNGYKTVEFVTDNPCGQNSCGETMFCLPVDCTGPGLEEKCTNQYDMLVRTAEYTGNTEAPFEAMPFSGVYDVAFNGLDNLLDGSDKLTKPKPTSGGKIIGVSENNPDNYWWSFFAKNEIDRSAPYVERTNPGVDTEDVDEEAPLEIGFSKMMWVSTLKDNIGLNEYPENICASGVESCEDAEKMDSIWYSSYAQEIANKTVVSIKHRTFGPNDLDLYYFPTIPSTIKSVNQNCMYPGYGPLPLDHTDKAGKFTGIDAVDEKNICKVIYNDNGDITSTIGCVPINPIKTKITSSTDTGCAYTTNVGNPTFVSSDVNVCVSTLEEESNYSYE